MLHTISRIITWHQPQRHPLLCYNSVVKEILCMEENYMVEALPLHSARNRAELSGFLMKHHLSFEEDIETACCVFDSDYHIVGCGCASGNLLKCFALDESLRGLNLTGSVITMLSQERFQKGYYDLFIITRSDNETLFTGCGFHTVVRTGSLVLLENRSDGPASFAASRFLKKDAAGSVGAIVMNCNPFTLGHRALIEYASAHCDALYVFVVEEDRSLFPTEVRYRLVREGVSDLQNVRVCLSGHYMISQATFPTYFLKENENAAELQADLDIRLFAERIAPLFHIRVRFAGEEPSDPVTAKYNDAMRTILPSYGIQFSEIPRVRQDDVIISASCVRKLLSDPMTYDSAYRFVPDVTKKYLKEHKTPSA